MQTQQNGKDANQGIQVQKPSLPKGGGSVQGMGETFAPNEFNGSASLTIPLPVSPCRGAEPSLSLNYSSGNGNSPFGLGWELSTPEIVRRTSKETPIYSNDDTFLYTAGDYLVPRMDENGNPVSRTEGKYTVYSYMPRKEGDFDKIERYINTKDPTDDYWKVTHANNVVNIYGKHSTAKIFNPENPAHIFKWLLEETFNDRGDHHIYVYEKENSDNIPSSVSEVNRDRQTQSYPAKVYYGNYNPITDGSIVTGESATAFNPEHWHFEIVFDYGTYVIAPSSPGEPQPWQISPHTVPKSNTWPCRLDPFSDYSPGFEIRTYRLCRNILLFHRFDTIAPHPVLTEALELGYSDSRILTRLNTAKHTGYQYLSESSAYQTKSLPELSFSYTSFAPLEKEYQAHAFETLVNEKERNIAQASNQPFYQLLDLFGEGIPGIFYNDGQSIRYRASLEVSDADVIYDAPKLIDFPNSNKASGMYHSLTDVTGNGKLDLMVSAPQQAGYYELDDEKGWRNFNAFKSFPSNYHYPNNDLLDVTGDGVADVLLIEPDKIRFNSSLREQGFAASIQKQKTSSVPTSKASAPNELLFYADMIGSGLAQRVRITQGRVECWPNLGYGKFGDRVVMDNAPNFGSGFDINRLLWADIDGSGTTDLAYISSSHIDIYINQSGNSFKETSIRIPLPASWDTFSHMQFADIKGNGTNCLVFSQTHPTPRQWYYDFNLTGEETGKPVSQKPYLLCEMDTNMGAKTLIQYASSVKFYLKDKLAGVPWITHLPFPVMVIESVTHIDEISLTRSTSSYAYSHGYYDGFERIFRGFGRVDRTDSSTFNEFLADHDGDQAAYQTPNLLTRTWYHTGAFIEQEDLLVQYRKEFWQGDSEALNLPTTQFDFINSKPVADTLRDAHRTLHGAVLRSEVYGNDDSPWKDIPYSVSETQFQVAEIQQLFTNKYSAFLLQVKQSIDYDYERNANDPRINHDFILQRDSYGHVLESCSVAYPRRHGNIPASMDAQTKTQQLKMWVTYAKDTLFNSLEADKYWHVNPTQNKASGGYLIGLDIENKEYEITGLHTDEKGYFSWSGIQAQIAACFSETKPGEKHGGSDWLSKIKNEVGRLLPHGEIKARSQLLTWQRNYFYDAATQKELPLGRILAPVLPHRTEDAEFDIEKLKTEFSFLTAQQLEHLMTEDGSDFHGAQGGYIAFDGKDTASGYYWNPGSSQNYGDASSFYLPQAFFDPFQYRYIYWGADKNSNEAVKTTYRYDQYRLFVQQVNDPLHNVTAITAFDYQTLHPITIKDINGNTSSVLLDPLGMVIASSENGYQAGQHVGFDDFSAFTPFSKAKIEEILTDPAKFIANPDLMNVASFFYYDLHSWQTSKTPPHFVNIIRNNYSIPVPEVITASYQFDISYSDGSGRLVQHKMYYDGSNEWLTSGVVRYDNKGQAIKKFEPYFDSTYKFALKEKGVTSTVFYDALGRDVLVATPVGEEDNKYQHIFSKTLFGALHTAATAPTYSGYLNRKLYASIDAAFVPSAWSSLSYDPNDSLKDSAYKPVEGANINTKAFEQAMHFANTPFEHIEDGLGRVVQSEQLHVPENEKNANYFTFDILGDELTSADQRLHPLKLNNFQHSYNLSKEAVKVVSVDAGTKWALNNVLGQPIFSNDSIRTQQFYQYDVLHRPVRHYVISESLSIAQTVKRVVYGDTPGYFKKPEALNLRGQAVISLDEAGLTLAPTFDINGHPLLAVQWVKSDYKKEADWDAIKDDVLHVLAGTIQGKYERSAFERISLPGALPSLLEAEVFISGSQLDAVGRIVNSTDADGNISTPEYYSTDWIKALTVNAGPNAGKAKAATPGFSNVQYNAKGQRLSISYANNTQTAYDYDPYSFELTRIKTTRKNGEIIQHLQYHHDPVGNVTAMNNLAAPIVLHGNQTVEAKAAYRHNSLYQLVEATGREHGGMWANTRTNQNKFNDAFFSKCWPQLSDGTALQNYTQQYHYDGAGNLIRLIHQGKNSATRKITIQQKSNRIASRSLGSITPLSKNYHYDNNGNMTTLDGCQEAVWNYRNNMQAAIVKGRPDKASDAEYYVYDGAGRRVRKVQEQKTTNGKAVKEVIYLGGIEVRKSYTLSSSGVKKLSRDWHVAKLSDGSDTFCVWRYWLAGAIKADEKKSQLRYQLNDALNSSTDERDENANRISYEEYFPYGGASIMAAKNQTEVKNKHYHYSGKEKDGVTGLYYYGMRYYCPWLARWTCTDPAGTIDGLNVYAFVKGNPVTSVDVGGMVGKERSVRKFLVGLYYGPYIKSQNQQVMNTPINNRYIGRPKGTDTYSENYLNVQAKALFKSYKSNTTRVHWKGDRDGDGYTSGIKLAVSERDGKKWSDNHNAACQALSAQFLSDPNHQGVGRYQVGAEISHAIAASNYAPNDELSAHPASAHQNTEWLAIETGVKQLIAKGTDFRVKVTHYVHDGVEGTKGTLKAARYKIYISGKKVFDHLALGDRGNIDSAESNYLTNKVANLDNNSIAATKFFGSVKGIKGYAPSAQDIAANRSDSSKSPMFTDLKKKDNTILKKADALNEAKSWYH